MMEERIASLKASVLGFVESCALGEVGRYRYSLACSEATLYSSSYAAMARDLLGDLEGLEAGEREEWVAYLNGHQDEDGLYRDPVIFGEGWYADDPLWCGRSHLTCHVVTALACLGAVAPREFGWLEPWRDVDRVVAWLGERDFGERVGWSGNEIMNVGTLLQYAREFQGDVRAGRAVACLLDWLETHQVRAETGVWGSLDVNDPMQRSHMVQAAYHWWPLFAYDGRPFPYAERAAETVLATQNPVGGFGWGVHNPAEPLASSACEDIDSLDPLARLLEQAPGHREEIVAAIWRGAEWVRSNQVADG
ncbi:MAG: hypothetical protein ABFD94_06520, partial [Armatimonadia bacterium]